MDIMHSSMKYNNDDQNHIPKHKQQVSTLTYVTPPMWTYYRLTSLKSQDLSHVESIIPANKLWKERSFISTMNNEFRICISPRRGRFCDLRLQSSRVAQIMSENFHPCLHLPPLVPPFLPYLTTITKSFRCFVALFPRSHTLPHNCCFPPLLSDYRELNTCLINGLDIANFITFRNKGWGYLCV